MRFDKPLLHALLLTLVAGIADAVGYITMGGVFTANMTGNTVLAGIAAAQGHYVLAGQWLAPLVTFFVGAVVARLLLRWCAHRARRSCSKRPSSPPWASCRSTARARS